MNTQRIVQATTENDLGPIYETNKLMFNEQDKQRLREDFSKDYFQVYFYLKDGHLKVDRLESINAYVVTYFSYSTWQNRVLSIADFWLDSSMNERVQADVLELFRQRLFSVARENNCKRINFHLRNTEFNQSLVHSLERFGMRNLTVEEEWNFFQMNSEELKEFIKDQLPLASDEFRMIKVEDMSLYAQQIHDHIHELSVFENLEDQFECSIEGLIYF